jgi:diguanylate cyclase (GGDEF)-like protein/PAS domain S-box-containing protein
MARKPKKSPTPSKRADARRTKAASLPARKAGARKAKARKAKARKAGLRKIEPHKKSGNPARAVKPAAARLSRVRAAALALLAADGPLGRHGAPALVVAGGAVLGANPAGQRLGEGYVAGRMPALARLVESVATSGAARNETLRLAGGPDGAPRIADMTALPLVDGAVLLIGRDATLDHNLRGALVDSRQRYKDLVEISSDFAWETGVDGSFVFVSPQGALGWRAEELVGRNPRDFLADGGTAEQDDAIRLPFQADRPVQAAELWFRRADGAPACVVATAAPLYDEGGAWRGARGVCRDVTEERQRDAALARAETRAQLLNYIVAAIRDDIVPQRMLDGAAAATARSLSAAGCTIFRARDRLRVAAGFTAAARFGRALEDAIGHDAIGHDAIGLGLSQRAAGTGRVASSAPVDLDLPGGGSALAAPTAYRRTVNGTICLWRGAGDSPWTQDDRDLLADVAAQLGLAIEQIANTQELERLSSTDGLTGLLNRRTFFQRLERRLAELVPDGAPGALMYVDLDNFKLVNDLFGHQRGDEALLAVTGLLKAAAGTGDLVARLGGDEFALWLDGCGLGDAPRRARALLESGQAIAHFSGNAERPVGLSIGMAVFEPAGGEMLEVLIARADAAMYKVKRSGKGSFAIAPPPDAGCEGTRGAGRAGEGTG